MKISNSKCSISVTSVKKKNSSIITQKAIDIQEHKVEKIFRVLSKNNRNWGKETIYSPGYFNNKTNFLLGNHNSILVFDANCNIIDAPDNSIENIKNKDGLFILYPIPCFNMLTNSSIIYSDLLSNKDITIELNSELGERFGKFLALNDDEKLIYPNKNFLNLVIDKKNGLSLNKNFLINSNPEFVLGILSGYYNANCEKYNTLNFIINPNVNIYLFTNILNYLGASYSIRKKDDQLRLVFQLPHIFEGKYNNNFIKKDVYVEYANTISLSNIELLKKLNSSEFKDDNSLNVNSGVNLLIPVSALDFIELTEEEKLKTTDILYDLSAENHEATNYSLPFTPFLKNSDGDILTLTGVFLKEANENAKKFSPENKDYYKDLNSGDIINWIADDAILGLYASTK